VNTPRALALAALLALAGPSTTPSMAAVHEAGAVAQTASHATPPARSCQLTASERIDMAQGMPMDCCKGHKGICGCRAGKIVCCDGRVSKDPNCTCHSDWGVEN